MNFKAQKQKGEIMIDFEKPVQMKNGTKVEIITKNLPGDYPILAKTKSGEYGIWDLAGNCVPGYSSISSNLENVPVKKHTVFVNIYRHGDAVAHDSVTKADHNMASGRVARIKVEAEEGRFDV